ncbi:MAG: porin, partial [Pseudomonadota bacterium]
MTNSKWLRRALLGGVALGVATTGAQADDLTALKAQLEALQSRVNQLESTPAPAALPDGASLITFKRGQGSLADWNVDRASEGRMPQDRGFTIAITPTADVPAPVTEVTVSGYVKGDVIYDFDQDSLGDTFTAGSGINNLRQNVSGVRLHARQSRFRIRSRTDTAIGQIRTLIEVDFFRFGTSGRVIAGNAANNGQVSAGNFNGNPEPRLRHAWGEWDMTPNWTLGVGRFWRISCDVFTSIGTVDFGGSAGGCSSTRAAQVRFTYTSGPLSFRFGIVEPLQAVDRRGPGAAGTATPATRTSPDFPNFAAALLYDAPGGHQLFIGAEVEHIDIDASNTVNRFSDDDVGWEVQAGANVNLADIATLTGHFQYGDGITNMLGEGTGNFRLSAGNAAGSQIITNDAWGAYIGLSFNVTDTTQFNVQYGHANPGCNTCAGYTSTNSIHANVLWRPVRQMRLGWELIYGFKRNTTATAAVAGRSRNEDA